MPQHDWQQLGPIRYCDVCDMMQRLDRRRGDWLPWMSAICPGEDDGWDPRRRAAHSGPGQRTRELECT